MDLDWLWPLLVGSGLTYGFTSLEGLRSRRHQDRRDAREKLEKALDLATTVSVEINDDQASKRFANDAINAASPAFWELRAIEEKLPDSRLRDAVRRATYIVTVAPAIANLGGWPDAAGSVQRAAANRLRFVLGAALRGERRLPKDHVQWLADREHEARTAIEDAFVS